MGRFCITHYKIKRGCAKAKEAHPEALLLVHPECRPEVVELADFVGSTKQIIDFATSSKAKEFIIGTEMGILYSLKNEILIKVLYSPSWNDMS